MASSTSKSHRPATSSFQSRTERRIAKAREKSPQAMALPERFRHEDEEDKDDGIGGGGPGDNAVFAQQSVYGMLAATQSRANFPSRFQQESESEGEGEEGEGSRKKSASESSSHQEKGEVKKHRHKVSDTKLVRSFLKPIKEKGGPPTEDPMTQSQLLPPRDQEQRPEEVEQPVSVRTDAPILDRKLQAMAKAEMESSASRRKSSERARDEEIQKEKASNSLPQVIADIFGFDEPEDVIAEFPCWYTANVLLQGFMYITEKNVCFYSYLQKKTGTTIKQGNLGKLPKNGSRYSRYYFVLKGESFSYYRSSADPYFPLGSVDLRYAISAEATMPGTGKEVTDFTITTPNRVYYYRADNMTSAMSWVKQLQQVIFRTRNDGDSVKLLIPLESIYDVERSEALKLADTVKLNVVADDTFAMDEYFFTFFENGEQAIEILSNVTEGSSAKQKAPDVDEDPASKLEKMELAERSPRSPTSPRPIHNPIRSTLSPLSMPGPSSPRRGSKADRGSSADISRTSPGRGRASFDKARRGGSGSKSPVSPSMQESVESFVTSSEQLQSASENEDAIDRMSASQMLTDDGLFHGTARRAQAQRAASNTIDERDSSPESSVERVRVHSSTRPPTELGPTSNRPKLQRGESGGSGKTVEADERQLQPAEGGPGRLVRGISTPFQHAINVAGMGAKYAGSYLSGSPKTYISNWSDAFAGGKRHYTDVEGLAPDDSVRDDEQEMDIAEHERRFRDHFNLPGSEKLLSVFYCYLHQTLPLYGKIYMGSSKLCFRSLIYGIKKKLIISYKDILNVQKQRGFRWGYPGLVLVIRGYEELFFDFPKTGLRDDAVVTVLRNLETAPTAAAESMILTEVERQDAKAAAAENELLRAVRKDGPADRDLQIPQDEDQIRPIVYSDSADTRRRNKPKESMRIVCLTIGTRGDVQPFIALCKGLLKDGHRPKIATHAEYKDWIEKHGIEFAEVAGNPAELMRICVDNGMFTPRFMFEANFKFRVWLETLCDSAWTACQDADLLIESPVAMAGIHIAEKLEIPYYRAFGMPWTRTRAYPHAFAVPGRRLGGAYNYMTYTLFDNVFWAWPSGQMNRWRSKRLDLLPTNLGKLQPNKVPFLYNFSPSVVVPPLDFSDWIKITGYWFLDEGTDYQPSKELANFIKKARDDEQKLVYIGFGSITVQDSKALTQSIVKAVIKADVRCILSKGWSDRLSKEGPNEMPVKLPACIHQIQAAPHDWLFKQVDAVVHHGGAGTTGASLRAGVPTIIKPFFGDQYFFANRVEDLGVGIKLDLVTTNELGKAIWIATHDERMRVKASGLGEQIRSEDGVQTAIDTIYEHLGYARALIKKRAVGKGLPVDGLDEEVESDDEENWTFVEVEVEGTDIKDDDEDEEDEESIKVKQKEAEKSAKGLLKKALAANKGK